MLNKKEPSVLKFCIGGKRVESGTGLREHFVHPATQ